MCSLESFPFEASASLELECPLSAALSESTSSDGSPPAKVEISSLESISSDGSPPAKVEISSSEGPPLKGKAVPVMQTLKVKAVPVIRTKIDSKYKDVAGFFSQPQVAAYFAQVEASGGFDVPSPPVELDDFLSLIRPIKPPLTEHLCQSLKPLCIAAIAHFNQNEHKQFEFVKLVKANNQGSCGTRYYITFEAFNPEDGTNQTLQAAVLDGISKVVGEPNLTVYYCKREADFKGGFIWN